MPKYSILLTAAVAFCVSCSSNDNANESATGEAVEHTEQGQVDNTATEMSEVSDTTAMTDANLSLNKGERWETNSEMQPHIQKGRLLVLGYLGEGGTDYKTLAAQLKEINNHLIESCTMKGEAHDQLHNWLYPHLELVKKLDAANSAEEANGIVQQLLQSYKTFDTYFQ